jgi:DNA-binding GntR family transcriptional regulator
VRDLESEHRALMEATLARDAARALTLLRAHLLTPADHVRTTVGMREAMRN